MCKKGAVNSDFIRAGDFLKIHEIMNSETAEGKQIVCLGIYKHK
jgi:Tfp pilus assembly ATPase PilU